MALADSVRFGHRFGMFVLLQGKVAARDEILVSFRVPRLTIDVRVCRREFGKRRPSLDEGLCS